MEICSIGASGTTAERFFTRLKDASVTAVIDTRLKANSQLAGFARGDSLAYFVPELLHIAYVYEPMLAPTAPLLKAYRDGSIPWPTYEREYLRLIVDRGVPESLNVSKWGERPVLLCSEPEPDFCHRRLAADCIVKGLALTGAVKHL